MEFNITSLPKLLDISARISGAIAVACILILFFPMSWLPFEIEEFRAQYGLWIFLVMAVTISLCVSYVVKWIGERIKEKFEKLKMRKAYKRILEKLSPSEKMFVKKYYNKGETAIYIDLADSMMKKLQTFNIISISAGTSFVISSLVPGIIQPWVFDTIDRFPNILDT